MSERMITIIINCWYGILAIGAFYVIINSPVLFILFLMNAITMPFVIALAYFIYRITSFLHKTRDNIRHANLAESVSLQVTAPISHITDEEIVLTLLSTKSDTPLIKLAAAIHKSPEITRNLLTPLEHSRRIIKTNNIAGDDTYRLL